MHALARFHGKTVVIKYGGAAMERAPLSRSFGNDLALLQHVGIHPLIVHGGAWAIPDEFVEDCRAGCWAASGRILSMSRRDDVGARALATR